MNRATILTIRSKTPKIHESVFLAEGARIIGEVEIGEGSSVWFNAVIRGDIHWVKIGRETNVQDGAVLHVTPEWAPVFIGDRVTIGHAALLHGCTVEDGSLIGIGAIVLDGAVIGRESLIAAGAVVTPKTVIPPRSLVKGNPGRVTRELDVKEIEQISMTAEHYVEISREYRDDQRR